MFVRLIKVLLSTSNFPTTSTAKEKLREQSRYFAYGQEGIIIIGLSPMFGTFGSDTGEF